MSDAEITLSVDDRQVRLALPDRETDHVQRRIHDDRRFYEGDLLAFAATLLEPGDVVVDVGAYIGNHSLYFSQICGAQVVAFEPNPESFALLERNVALNDASETVIAHGRALGAARASGRVDSPDPANKGDSRVVIDQEGPIEVVSLDAVELPGPVRLIKIDVQGMELDVLRGAVETIGRDGPEMFIEATTSDQLGRLVQLLEGWGYVPRAQFGATPTILFTQRDRTAFGLEAQLSLATHLLKATINHSSTRLRSLIEKERKSDHDPLPEQLSRLEGSLTGVQGSLTGVRGSLTGVQGTLTGLERSLATLQSAVAGSISGLEGAVTRLVTGLTDSVESITYAQRTQSAALEAVARDGLETSATLGGLGVAVERLGGLEERMQRMGRQLDRIDAALEAQLMHARRVEAEMVGLKRRLPRQAAPLHRPVVGKPRRPLALPEVRLSQTHRRKLRKLVRDPRAFLADSKSPALNAIGARLFD